MGLAMDQGILTGPEILKQVKLGSIEIDPFDTTRINPASYDLALGDSVSVYAAVTSYVYYSKDLSGRGLVPKITGVLDSKAQQEIRTFKIGSNGWVLKPGIGYLMHTKERVKSTLFNPVLDGKSSIGRLFIKVHETAGYGDIGFDGQYTLEVTAVHPVIVYAGMRICQIRFHTVKGDIQPYHGNYTGSDAQGAIGSKSWKQF